MWFYKIERDDKNINITWNTTKGLEYTGSQYSFKDPLIVTIPQVRNI